MIQATLWERGPRGWGQHYQIGANKRMSESHQSYERALGVANAISSMHNVIAMEEKGLKLPSFNRIPGAIAIDLDGTLLNSQTQLSERNRAAVEACIARGIPVVIATSRPARTTRRALGDSLSDKCSLIIMNGALALGVPPLSGKFRESLTLEIARGAVDLLMSIEPEVKLNLELEGWEFGSNWNNNPEQLWRYNAATQDMVMTLEEALARGPGQNSGQPYGEGRFRPCRCGLAAIW